MRARLWRASAAWKIRDRDLFIGWDEQTKRKRLLMVVNNVRFLIFPWIQVEHLASKILSMSLKRLSDDWRAVFGHRVYLAEAYDKEHPEASPTIPSGMIPVYLKPTRGRRRKSLGRKAGHPGVSRQVPQRIDHHQEHALLSCPECQPPVGEPINIYCRIIEDIPEVTKHTVHGYWRRTCKKIVHPTVSDALPNAMIGLRLIVFTAWRHYLVGVSVSSLVRMVSVFSQFKIRAGGLTQAWKALAKQGCFYHLFTEPVIKRWTNTMDRLRGRLFARNCPDSSKTPSVYQKKVNTLFFAYISVSLR